MKSSPGPGIIKLAVHGNLPFNNGYSENLWILISGIAKNIPVGAQVFLFCVHLFHIKHTFLEEGRGT